MVKRIHKNKYLKNTKISEAKFRLVLKHFCLDDTVERTSQESGLSRKAITRLFGLLRQYVFNLCEEEFAFSGEVEVNESYFGAKRIRGKRGCGAQGKIPVFDLLKRGGNVYTKIVENCSREQLLPIIQGKVLSKSIGYSDGWRSYDGLIYQGVKFPKRGECCLRLVEHIWQVAF